MTQAPRRGRLLRRSLQVLTILIGVGILILAAGAFWLRGQLRGSLPRMDGEIRVAGLDGQVRVDFDDHAVPVIHAGGRLDAARALGFLHGQNRFFQMDLMRRASAGELAELLGPPLLTADRSHRLHRFRARARRVLESGSEQQSRLLEAYAAGVNAGLAALDTAPVEYLVLRSEPSAWTPEDSVLVILAMFLQLNDDRGRRESTLGLMHDLLPGPLFEFLTPPGTEWDAPVDGPALPGAPLPGPEVFDLRTSPPGPEPEPAAGLLDAEPIAAGSNSWAVAGRLTKSGVPLLANDMHLGLSVPNVWYRAGLEYPRGQELWRVDGATLPGAPTIIVGSNTRIAWGFTNSYGDWVDLVIVDPDPADPSRYLAPDGSRPFVRHEERIRVRGAEDETLEVLDTLWGPIVDTDHLGRQRAVRWIAHHPEAVNMNLELIMEARSVDDALQAAARAGIPPVNVLVADADGNIGWTIAGAIPRRVGENPGRPVAGAAGDFLWDGWLPAEEYPRIVNPESGLLWTANNRVVGGEMLRLIGDGGLTLGARARQIRDDLLALEQAGPQDMLGIQLDDRAIFLQRWRDLLLDVLSPAALETDPRRAELRRFVADWGGRAALDSVGYRMVRAFRGFVEDRVFGTLTAPCKKASEDFNYRWLPRREGPLWQLVSQRPAHLLDPAFDDWQQLLLASVDDVLDYFVKDGSDLARRTWGERNTTRITHPLSAALPPSMKEWVDMPPLQLPGDNDMPRVQAPSEGASQRMVVAPGREREGIFHMPGGQSGHPLSDHYRDGHAAWAAGEPTPFLPGPPVSTLLLEPAN